MFLVCSANRRPKRLGKIGGVPRDVISTTEVGLPPYHAENAR